MLFMLILLNDTVATATIVYNWKDAKIMNDKKDLEGGVHYLPEGK
jgi:hypothetical protein